MVRSRWAASVAIGLLAVALAWVGWLLVGGWRVREGLSWSRRRIAEGRYAAARERLAWLADWCPRDDAVAYLLGDCEAKLGRPEAAVAAWGSVSSRSALADSARLAEGRVLIRSLGRLGDCRAPLSIHGPEPLRHGDAGPVALAELLLWEGRIDELRRLLREIEGIGPPTDRIAALREHWRLDSVIVAAEEVGSVLDQAERTAPDDPYVWLARAHLATQYGRLDEAREWLDHCEVRQSSDPALAGIVPRARLRWAMAAGRADEARRALAMIPVDRFSPQEGWSIRAWFAARRGDPEAERDALEHLVEIEPGDTRALDRLAELAIRGGQADRAAAIRRRQEESLRDKERYRRLLIADRGEIGNDELRERARLAERLGRRFEAEGWLALAVQRVPDDREARATLDRLMARKEPVPAGSLLDFPRETATEARAGTTADSPSAAIAFRDDAETVGLRFTYHNGETPQHQIPETIGGGVAVLDYDGDGWLDVYLVQGGSFPPAEETRSVEKGAHEPDRRAPTADRLFRNRGDGTFEDATDTSGLAQIRPRIRLRRDGGRLRQRRPARPVRHPIRVIWALSQPGRRDVRGRHRTRRAGRRRDWPTSSAFADLDGDGDLDLYVCHYLAWDARNPTLCRDDRAADRHVSCLPLGFPAEPDHLFRNDGGRFVDVTAEAGIVDRDGRGLGVVAVDFDDDGRLDLFVANDMTANLLFHNRGGLKFEEIGHVAGVASNSEGGYQAGMGVACGDLDGDGRPDLAVTNFFGEFDDLLPEPRRRDVRRRDRGRRPQGPEPVPARFRRRVPRR